MATTSKRPTVCTYYFPNWHVEPRNEVIHGKGWTEWRVTQYATPRFEGHKQPKVPLWGYEDEADPVAMSKKIAAAADHGIDAFIFDWYFFESGLYREQCLEQGFLKAKNTNDLKFAIMWANHNPIYAHPGSYMKPAEPLWPGKVDAATFIKCTDYCIEKFFSQPNYLRVDGALYFSFFRPKGLIEDLGGTQVARLLFDDFRHRVEKAGLGKLMLDGRVDEMHWDHDFDFINKLIKDVGFDCGSNYNWRYRNKEDFPALDYTVWAERNRPENSKISSSLCVPYNPLVLTGWDSSPRTVQSDMYDKHEYPFGTVVVNNTPAAFEKVLRETAEFLQSPQATSKMVQISCWNEWTEGAYLEPDTEYGYGYLEAVKKVFGKKS